MEKETHDMPVYAVDCSLNRRELIHPPVPFSLRAAAVMILLADDGGMPSTEHVSPSQHYVGENRSAPRGSWILRKVVVLLLATS